MANYFIKMLICFRHLNIFYTDADQVLVKKIFEYPTCYFILCVFLVVLSPQSRLFQQDVG